MLSLEGNERRRTGIHEEGKSYKILKMRPKEMHTEKKVKDNERDTCK